MTTRADIVAEARSWLKTRWHHQASTKGVGCDCVGLVRGVGVETRLFPKDWHSLPGAAVFAGYGRHAFRDTLERGCAMFLTPIAESEAGPGDIVVMRFGGVAHHLGILGDYPGGGLSVIHAYAPLRRVVESRLDQSFRDRIISWHRFPGVER